MTYKVKRVFGGFTVQDESGKEVKAFTGAGAKAKAEFHAIALNNGDQPASEPNGAPEGYTRGGYRGGKA